MNRQLFLELFGSTLLLFQHFTDFSFQSSSCIDQADTRAILRHHNAGTTQYESRMQARFIQYGHELKLLFNTQGTVACVVAAVTTVKVSVAVITNTTIKGRFQRISDCCWITIPSLDFDWPGSGIA